MTYCGSGFPLNCDAKLQLRFLPTKKKSDYFLFLTFLKK